ncbi:hypothetical protein H5410_005368 [Solanum commersonii]|uniref:Reverse transcriptase domain-containing protein n=1 Tax=Solanum commersonii TaxID=4109 RepID=A0A9J6A683_SOLCO|nr:hypothetical protein H5410_005368 [Solanum commersonii]
MHDRLEVILPLLISKNQSDFVKGRNIIENILLAQEIITSIRKKDTTIKGFGMPKWSSDLSHLPYADDTIIFVYVDEYSLNLVMNTLNEYEGISGQTINKEESFFLHRSRGWDNPWWMLTSFDKFTVSSAWNILRREEEEQFVCYNIWNKGLLFKVFIFHMEFMEEKTVY